MRLYAVFHGGSYGLFLARSAHEALLKAASGEFSVRPATNEDIAWYPAGEELLAELAQQKGVAK